MSAVFFLFLFHSAVGLMGALALVPETAGDRFFKFCSATSAFMTTAGIWLLARRFGLAGGPGAPGGPAYSLTLATAATALVFMILYNRARLFGWSRLQGPCLAGALLAGGGAVVAGAPEGSRAFVACVDACSALLIGASAGAMILGHWYLVVLDLPISALRRLTVLLAAGLVLRGLTVALALLGVAGALEGARAVAMGLWSPDGIFVWMRLLFGIAAPASLIGFIWKTVEIRSTQSATGILYVQLFLVMSGELLAKYLRVAAGFPL
jgi:hypothetical protein